MEAIILAADMLAMVYLCWRVFRFENSPGREAPLGVLSYSVEKDQQP